MQEKYHAERREYFKRLVMFNKDLWKHEYDYWKSVGEKIIFKGKESDRLFIGFFKVDFIRVLLKNYSHRLTVFPPPCFQFYSNSRHLYRDVAVALCMVNMQNIASFLCDDRKEPGQSTRLVVKYY